MYGAQSQKMRPSEQKITVSEQDEYGSLWKTKTFGDNYDPSVLAGQFILSVGERRVVVIRGSRGTLCKSVPFTI